MAKQRRAKGRDRSGGRTGSAARSGASGPRPGPAPVMAPGLEDKHSSMCREAAHLYEGGEVERAKALWSAVLAEDIEHPHALHGMGIFARDAGRFDVAAELMRRGLLREPRNFRMLSNLGTVYEKWGKHDEAARAYRSALGIRGEEWVLLNNLGSCHARMNRRQQALAAFERAVALGGNSPDLFVNMGTMLSDLGRYEEAEPWFEKAVAVDDGDHPALFNYSAFLMKQGRWREAWDYYERRFQKREGQVPLRPFPQPVWDGGRYDGERLLAWSEQGVGDEIRHASMVPDMVALGGALTLECEPRLVGLFQRSFPAIEVVPRPFAAAERGEIAFDAVCPMGTAGKFLRAAPSAFPRHRGYLVPDPDRVSEMRRRLADAGPPPYVGLCWRSGMTGAFRSEFYVDIDALAPVLKRDGVTFVNLQYDDAIAEVTRARERYGAVLHRWEDLDLRDDLDGAAALTVALDLVVSAATSVSTMAGALGVETLEFRPFAVPEAHLVDGRCPWFPSVRFVDKRASEPWDGVFRAIAKRMSVLVERDAGRVG